MNVDVQEMLQLIGEQQVQIHCLQRDLKARDRKILEIAQRQKELNQETNGNRLPVEVKEG